MARTKRTRREGKAKSFMKIPRLFGTTHFRKFWNKIRMIDETRTSALLCVFFFGFFFLREVILILKIINRS